MKKNFVIFLLQLSAWCAGSAFVVLGSAGVTTAGLVFMFASLAFAGVAFVFYLLKF